MEVFFIDDIDKLLGEGFSLQIRIDSFGPIVYSKKCPAHLILRFLRVVEDFIMKRGWFNQLEENNTFRFELSKEDNGMIKINEPK